MPAVMGSAHAINGSISLEAYASVAALTGVNGSIELAQQARVSGNLGERPPD